MKAPPSCRRRAVLALATSLLSAAAALGLGEAVARRTYGEGFETVVDPYEDHSYRPLRTYRQTWGGRAITLHTNSLGWKDERPGREVAKSVAPRQRMVLLGDSFTEGLGCRQEETLGGVAQRALGPGWEVLNGGRASYCPLLSYQRLKRFLAAGYRADAVVLLPDVSDVQDEVTYAARYLFAPDGEPLRFAGLNYWPPLRWLYNHSALVRTVRRRAGPPLPLARPPGDSPEVGDELARPGPMTAAGLHAASPATYGILRANWPGHTPSLEGWAGEGLRSLEVDVLRIERLARGAGMRLVVALYPWPQMLYTADDPELYRRLAARFPLWMRAREAVYGTRPSPRRTVYQERLQALCSAHGIPLVDLIPVFQETADWPSLYLAGDVHWNADGHRLVGERIARAVREQP